MDAFVLDRFDPYVVDRCDVMDRPPNTLPSTFARLKPARIRRIERLRPNSATALMTFIIEFAGRASEAEAAEGLL